MPGWGLIIVLTLLLLVVAAPIALVTLLVIKRTPR